MSTRKRTKPVSQAKKPGRPKNAFHSTANIRDELAKLSEISRKAAQLSDSLTAIRAKQIRTPPISTLAEAVRVMDRWICAGFSGVVESERAKDSFGFYDDSGVTQG